MEMNLTHETATLRSAVKVRIGRHNFARANCGSNGYWIRELFRSNAFPFQI